MRLHRTAKKNATVYRMPRAHGTERKPLPKSAAADGSTSAGKILPELPAVPPPSPLARHPRLAAALCAVAVALCMVLPAAFLYLTDLTVWGRTDTIETPYSPPTPSGDDYYLLRQLRARAELLEQSGTGISRPSDAAQTGTAQAPSYYVKQPTSSPFDMLQEGSYSETLPDLLNELVAQGVLPQSWVDAALSQIIEDYTVYLGSECYLGAPFYSLDSMGFLTLKYYTLQDDFFCPLMSVTVDSQTGLPVEVWLSMPQTMRSALVQEQGTELREVEAQDGDEAPYTPDSAALQAAGLTVSEDNLHAYLSLLGLDALGDWQTPTGTPYSCGLYSENGQALLTISTADYTIPLYSESAQRYEDAERCYCLLTLTLAVPEELPEALLPDPNAPADEANSAQAVPSPETSQTVEPSFTVKTLSLLLDNFNTGKELLSLASRYTTDEKLQSFGIDPDANSCSYAIRLSDMHYAVALHLDYATGEQCPLCAVPGCTHDSFACPAYVTVSGSSDASEILCAGGRVYVLTRTSDTLEDCTDSLEQLKQQRALIADASSAAKLYDFRIDVMERAIQAAGQPLTLAVFDEDWQGRTQIAVLTDESCDENLRLFAYDEDAVYGYNDALGCGVRIALADGAVQTFSLAAGETVIDVIGTRLLTVRRLACGASPSDTDAADAVDAGGWCELDLLDPATGEREAVCTRVTSLGSVYYTYDYLCHNGTRLWFMRLESDSDGSSAVLSYFDLSDGTSGVYTPEDGQAFSYAYASRLYTAQNGTNDPYLVVYGYDGIDSRFLLDLTAGTLYDISGHTVLTFAGSESDSPEFVCETDDGRFVLASYGVTCSLALSEQTVYLSDDYTADTPLYAELFAFPY